MRRNLNIILIIAAVLQVSICLRLHAHGPVHRYAQAPDQLTGLSDAEAMIQAQLSIINLQISATNNTINKNIYVANQNSTTKLTLFNSQDPPTENTLCLVFDPSQSEDVQLYISSIQTKLENVRNDISALGSTSKNRADLTYLKDKYHRQNQYYKYLLLNPCEYKAGGQTTVSTSPLDAAQLNKVLRLSPTQWFVNEYSKNYIGSAPSNSCPKQRPYVVDGSCQQCQAQRPYYDSNAKKCVNCPAGYFFSQISHSCQKNDLQHCNGGRYEASNGVCLCRTETPFWDGMSCIGCFVPNYFSFTAQKCVSCPSGYYHNGIECVVTNCTQTFTFDIYNRRCVCPWYQPKLINDACFPCDPGQIYNNYTRQCQPCPDGTNISPDSVMCLCSSLYQTYSFVSNTCECPYNSPILNQQGQCVPCKGYYDAVNKKCLDCPVDSNQVKNPETGACECIPEFPLFAGGICRSCKNSSYYFDLTRSKCVLCPNGMSVALQNNTCMCFHGQIYVNQSCVCPQDKPYLGKTNCITCVFPKYFSQVTRTCQVCPAGSQYDQASKTCLKVDCGKEKIYIEANQACTCVNKSLQYILPDGSCSLCRVGEYQENGVCKNCTSGRVYNYTFKKCGCNETQNLFWNQIQCVKCEHPQYWDFGDLKCKSCPDQQIYNIFSKQCEYCPARNPYYNGQYCTICPNNQYYNTTTHKCIPCTGGKIYDNAGMQCVCPEDHPIDTPKGCIQCYLPNYFDGASQSCLSCPKNTAFNPTTSSCVVCPADKPVTVNGFCTACPDNKYFNASTGECQSCSANRNYNKETKLCVCPDPAQFFDGSKCLFCYLPQYFDLADLKCKNCPANQIYDPINYRCTYCPDQRPLLNGSQCVPCPDNTYFNSTTFTCVSCSGNRLYNKTSQTCECPRNRFWNDANCVECYHPKYFDFTLKLCLSCPKNQIYDISLKACTQCPYDKPKFDGSRCVPCPVPSYWNYTVKDCVNCTGGRVYDYQIADCKCEKASTFFDSNKCVECYHPKYFDFSLLKCVSCPHNKIYDLELKACVDCPQDRPLFDGDKCVQCQKGTFWNISELECASCTGGRVFNEQSQLCECPSDKFWNDVSCISCFIPKYFDFNLKQCLNCPPNMIYDIDQRLCVYCPSDRPYFDGLKCTICETPTYYDPTLRTCTSCTLGRVYNSQSQQCQCATGKFWTGYSCIECFHPKYFDLDERKCLNCPTNQVYSIEQRKCIDCPASTPVFNGAECVKCPSKQYYDPSFKVCKYCSGGRNPNEAGVCECPTGMYWTEITCIQCYHPRYFDYDSKKCLSCPVNQIYHIDLKKCLDCPAETPVFNGENCEACPADKYYNTQYKSCQSCPASQVVNPATRQCECTNGRFWTGSDCIQCYHPQYFDVDQRKCMSCPANQLYNIALKKCDYCPSSIPYFDGKTCLACPRGSVFDLNSRQCLACSSGTQFDQATGKCECPADSFWNGTKCLTCFLPQYFDLDTKSCKDCPEGQHFDRVKRICVPSL